MITIDPTTTFAISLVISFVFAELITRGAVYQKGTERTGIFVAARGRYYRVHHWQLGLFALVFDAFMALIALVVNSGSMWAFVAVFAGIGAGITISGLIDDNSWRNDPVQKRLNAVAKNKYLTHKYSR